MTFPTFWALSLLACALPCVSGFAADVTLVAKGTIWKYLDNGSDQGTTWTAPGFADSAWASGAAPLGYSSTAGMYGTTPLGTTVGFGGNASAKYPTTYFRKNFSVTGAAGVTSLQLNVLRDDGVVVYLNGTEVGRRGMPAGTITFTTYASETVNTTTSYNALTFAPSALVEGNNVLAIELHQVGPASSDLVLDAELIASSTPVSRIASGPWVGAVTPQSAVVTARLDTADLDARLVASTAEDLSNPVYSPIVTSAAASGETVRLAIDGLQVDTVYYYALEVEGVLDASPQRRGTFHTFPSGAASVRIAMGACAQTDIASLAFDALLAASPRLFINMGDFHYNDTNSTNVALYRANYASVFANASQAALYRSVPSAYVWDDHDYCGNDSNRTSTGRSAVRQAYREWVPHYPLPGGPGAAIHQSFSIGRVRVIMTDLRSEADPRGATDSATKTKLGVAQKAWFKQQLLAARDEEAPLILWVCSAPWIGAATTTTDTWQSHATERRELADFIKDNAIKNVVLLSGDMHALAYDDGTNSDYATGGGAPLKVLHAAALGRNGSTKGGPYSSGAPIQNAVNSIGQYGLVDITDAGGSSTVGVTFTGWRVQETSPRLTYTFNTAPVKPRTPLDPAAAVAANGITLTWRDDSAVESGFRVERRAQGSGSWTTVGETAANIGTLLDSGASPGATYSYRVLALNATELSAPSAEVSATALTLRQAWKAQTLGDAFASDAADPDGDGLTTLAEYGLGTHPATPSTAPAAALKRITGLDYLTITFDRPSGRDDVNTRGEVTADLAGEWSSSTEHVRVDVSSLEGGMENVLVRDLLPTSTNARRFLRVRFSPAE